MNLHTLTRPEPFAHANPGFAERWTIGPGFPCPGCSHEGDPTGHHDCLAGLTPHHVTYCECSPCAEETDTVTYMPARSYGNDGVICQRCYDSGHER